MASSRLLHALKSSSRCAPEYLQRLRAPAPAPAAPWAQAAATRFSAGFPAPTPAPPQRHGSGAPAPAADGVPGHPTPLEVQRAPRDAGPASTAAEARGSRDFTPALQKWYGRVLGLSGAHPERETAPFAGGPQGSACQGPARDLPPKTSESSPAASEWGARAKQEGPSPWYRYATGLPQGNPAEAELLAHAFPEHGPRRMPSQRGNQLPATMAALRLVEELARSAGHLSLARSGCDTDPGEAAGAPGDSPHAAPFASAQLSWFPPTANGGRFESPLGSSLVQKPELARMYGPYSNAGRDAGTSSPSGSHDAGRQSPSVSASAEGTPSAGRSTLATPQGASCPSCQSCQLHPGGYPGQMVPMPHYAAYMASFSQGHCGVQNPGGHGMHPVVSEKKLRRLVSNRASAKRSRKRRQDRLQELEVLTTQLRAEQAQVHSRLSDAQSTLHKCEEENARLKSQIQALKEGCCGAEEAAGLVASAKRRRGEGGLVRMLSKDGSLQRHGATPPRDTCPHSPAPRGIHDDAVGREEDPEANQVDDPACPSLALPHPPPMKRKSQHESSDLHEFFSYLGCDEQAQV